MLERAALKDTFLKEGQETELRAKTGLPQTGGKISSKPGEEDENMSVERDREFLKEEDRNRDLVCDLDLVS